MTRTGDRCSSPTAGSSIRTRRRCSRPGRRAPPTRRRRSKRAATMASGASCDASSAILPACRDGCRCRSAALPRGDEGAPAAHDAGNLLGSARGRVRGAPPRVARRARRCRSRRRGWRPPAFPAASCTPSRRPSYDYDRRAPLWDTRYPRGFYTALGPGHRLVAAEDGAVAIFGPGEELQLEFAASLPPPKPGWTRRFVLEARGWCKDMDLYTKDGETVEPLPGTRGPAAAALQRRYTTRYESGR